MPSSPPTSAESVPESSGDKREVTRKDWVSLWAVLLVQAQNAFNDNFVKITLIVLAAIVAKGSWIGDDVERVLPLLIPIPFILLAPIAGYFSDRFSKRRVIVLCLIAQLGIFALIAISIATRNISIAMFGFFMLAVQSTFFSPAKQGILKEVIGSERLGFANGMLSMLTMVGILAGMWLGGVWFAQLSAGYNAETGNEIDSAWRAAMIPTIVIGVGALVPLFLSRMIEPTPSHPKATFRKGIWVSHFVELSYLFSHRKIRIVSLLIALYWLVANFLAITTMGFARALNDGAESGGQMGKDSANMLASVGIGLMVGSIFVSILSKKKIRIGLIPIGGFGMAIGLAGIGLIPPGAALWWASFAFIGFASGFYLIPLSALIQDLPEEQHRARVLAAANLMNSFSGIVAIGASHAFTHWVKITASIQVSIFVIPLALAALYVFRLPKILRQA